MSTTIETRGGRHAREPARDDQRMTHARNREPSRWSDWTSSWRVALRMARRDLRRHQGRSVVVTLMVGIPLLILSFLASVGWVSLSAEPRPEHIVGDAAAVVRGPVTEQVLQDGSSQNTTRGSAEALPIPGLDPAATTAQNAAAIGALTGGTATPVASQHLRIQLGDRRVAMTNLALDGSVGFGDKAQLLSGRWPSGPGEALVSEQGIRKGLPESGTFELVTRVGDTISTATITVTGIGTGVTEWGMIPHLISAERLGPGDPFAGSSGEWLITGTGMPFAKVSELGTYGLYVQSAELMRNPVPASQLPDELRSLSHSDDSMLFFWLAGAIVLALVIGLLVAPAFAVSASRQRHTLALAASNGATTRQLRRTVLAQALVLGVLAAVIGAAVGVGIAAILAYVAAGRATDVHLPIFAVPWPLVIGFTTVAIIAAVTAALVPARRLGRLDIMGVLKGQNVSGPPSRIVPILGVLAMIVGSVGLLLGARQLDGGDYIVAFASIGVVVGALALVPIALVAFGRLGAGLPVSLRMATRDAARQRTRSVPTAAAVMGGVAALTIGLIAGTSDSEEARVTYQPQTVMGQGRVLTFEDADLDSATAVVQERLPGASIVPYAVAGDDWSTIGEESTPFVTVTSPGCSGEQAVYDREHVDAQEAAYEAASDPESFRWEDPPCRSIGGPSGSGGEISVLPADELIDRLQLTGAEAELARTGAAFVHEDRLGTDEATAYSGTYAVDPQTGIPTEIEVATESTLSLIVVPSAVQETGATFDPHLSGMLVATEVAEAEGWPLIPRGFLINAPDGISDADRTAIGERLQDASLYVERGWQDATTLFFGILVAGVAFILLVVVLTATALSMAEQRRDDSTLAAVGATRATRRSIAAAQAFVISAIGAVLGLIVGLVPGIALAYPLTRTFPDGVRFGSDGQILPDTTVLGPFIAIPYAWLAVIAIGVPVLAALFPALAVRRAPVVTRRAD